jgi:membrane fusion protein, multidrug efflux system
MRIKSSYLFVTVVAAAVLLYFIVGGLLASGKADATARPAAKAAAAPTVQTVLTPEQAHPYAVTLHGRTEAARTVEVRSETSGVVAQAPAAEGAFVRRGAVLCRLAVDARQAALDEARAALKSRQLQQQASAELAKKGFRSPNQVLADQANLDAAQAAARQAEIALEQVNIRAPFAGVFDHRAAEVGSYLSPGQPCGTLIELDPLLVTGDVPETEAPRLAIGRPAAARLVSGQTLAGTVRYVARDADPQTRTYRVEIAVPNPGLAARAGLSADVAINVGSGPAHLTPVSALVLDGGGRQGVRYVAAGEKVAFAPVIVLEETPAGVWVSGLRGAVRLITVGQSFVAEGQKVRATPVR